MSRPRPFLAWSRPEHENEIEGRRKGLNQSQIWCRVYNGSMNWLARLGLNTQFVAFMAHCFTAAYLVSHSHGHRWIGWTVILVWATIKEFWFDSKYEHQPFWDNMEDWIGYMVGASIGLLG